MNLARIALASVMALGCLAGPAAAGKVGSEVKVTSKGPRQSNASVATLNDGKSVATWQSLNQEDYSYNVEFGVYAQMYNSDGSRFKKEFRVNFSQPWSQKEPDVAALSNGGFVVVFEDLDYLSDYDILGEIYNKKGRPKIYRNFDVNSTTSGGQASPSVTGLDNGDFVVVWQSGDGDEFGIFGQRFNYRGKRRGPEFQVNTTTTGQQLSPSIAAIGNNFVVSWESTQNGHFDVYGQLFNRKGKKLGPEFPVNSYTNSDQRVPDIAGLNGRNVVVTWSSLEQDGSGYGVYAQRFRKKGRKVKKKGKEFRVNTETAGFQANSTVAGLGTGGFAITWRAEEAGGEYTDIFARRFNSEGVADGPEFLVNSRTKYDQYEPDIAPLGENGFFAVWTLQKDYTQISSDTDIRGQRFD